MYNDGISETGKMYKEKIRHEVDNQTIFFQHINFGSPGTFRNQDVKSTFGFHQERF